MAWLVEDQYLRRGLRLKSVSSGFKLAASEFKGTARFNRG
ncbi:hypothetical protein CNW10_1074 [Lactiplantibacillus plantarum]|nr:hypothetical protein LpDm1_1105 [Lactiplantibacillus plantarum]KZU18986.1 hypothetical protein CNW10_1074 [Lactiplantibacillus plantarum]